MVIQKITFGYRAIKKTVLEDFFAQQLNAVLLEELPVESPEIDTELYHRHLIKKLRPLGKYVSTKLFFLNSAKKRSLKRAMLLVSNDLVGETRYRLTYAFKYFGFIHEEILGLHNDKWWVRAKACRTVSLMRAEEAIPHLVHLLDDEQDDVRIEAAQALIDIAGVKALMPLLHNLKVVSLWMEVRLANSIFAMGSEAVPDLIAGLKSDFPRVQKFCLTMLGELGDISAVPTILEYIDYELPDVQCNSLIALGKLGDNTSVPVILKYIHSPDEQLRKAATQALGHLASPQTVRELHTLLMNDTIEVRLAAGEALKRADEMGEKTLLYAFRSNDEIARKIALQYLEDSPLFKELEHLA